MSADLLQALDKSATAIKVLPPEQAQETKYELLMLQVKMLACKVIDLTERLLPFEQKTADLVTADYRWQQKFFQTFKQMYKIEKQQQDTEYFKSSFPLFKYLMKARPFALSDKKSSFADDLKEDTEVVPRKLMTKQRSQDLTSAVHRRRKSVNTLYLKQYDKSETTLFRKPDRRKSGGTPCQQSSFLLKDIHSKVSVTPSLISHPKASLPS